MRFEWDANKSSEAWR